MINYPLLLHGFLTLLAGNLAGIAYSRSIRKIIDNEHGWKIMHSALLAAFTAKRGLDKKEPGRANRLVYIFYYFAALLSFIYTFVFIFLIFRKIY